MSEDADYRKTAELMYARMINAGQRAYAMQAEYGKWLINTLWLMHSGAIVGLLFKATAGNVPPPYLSSVWWFIFGIVFAFGAGFAAWWNFTFAAVQCEKWANFRMFTDREHWPSGPIDRKLMVTLWVSVGCGFASIICLIGGAASVWCTWR
jgi:hypothetical protein